MLEERLFLECEIYNQNGIGGIWDSAIIDNTAGLINMNPCILQTPSSEIGEIRRLAARGGRKKDLS